MRNTYLILLTLLTVFTANAQTTNDSISNVYQKQNEIKLNGILLLVGAFEVSYERNLSEDTSVGVSFFTPYDAENIDADLNYYISPYFRVFFGEKYAAGFFVEGFGMLNSIDRRTTDTINDFFETTEEAVTDFALGFGVGGKWVTHNGFVFELTGGIGRNLFRNNGNETRLVGKFGFNLGYRF